MYLAIDQGNTSIKLALANKSQLLRTWKQEPGEAMDLVQFATDNNVVSAIYSSVSGKEMPEPVKLLEHHLPLVRFGPETPIPLRNDYDTPLTLGYDRLADAVAAWKLFPGDNSLVIDMGTCINYEFVSSEGAYKGGAISPGMRMRFRSMHDYTGKLPLIDERFMQQGLTGADTLTSMLSGVMNGILLEADGVIEQYRLTYGKMNVILTGGDADYFGKYLKNKTFAQPDLVLLGLLEILRLMDEK